MRNYRGQTVGAHRLTDVVGTGPYGTVYAAEVGQVAVKIFDVELTPAQQQYFSPEAWALNVVHPHILPLRGHGMFGWRPYVVMELLPEGNLRQQHPRGSRVPLPQVVDYVQQLAQALQFAHDHGLLHRDLRPENVLLRSGQHLMLSDFCIGILFHAFATSPRVDQEYPERVAYTAPEQLAGQHLTASDQYALAVMVYEWLCGVRPFHGSQEAMMYQQLAASPTPLRTHLPTLEPAVEAVVLRALSKDPYARFSSVQEFAQALTCAQYGTMPVQPGYQAISPASYGTARAIQAYRTRLEQQRPGTFSMLGAIALILGSTISLLTLFTPGFLWFWERQYGPEILSSSFILCGLIALYLRIAAKTRWHGLIGLTLLAIGWSLTTLFEASFYFWSWGPLALFYNHPRILQGMPFVFNAVELIGLIVFSTAIMRAADLLHLRARGWGWLVIIASAIMLLSDCYGLLNPYQVGSNSLYYIAYIVTRIAFVVFGMLLCQVQVKPLSVASPPPLQQQQQQRVI